MTLLAYLLKLIAVSAILFGYYRLFLRNKRFHHYNRFFLLCALLFSIVLPFIRIPLLYQPENPVHEAMYRTVSIINADYSEQIAEAPMVEPLFTVENLLFLLYILGALLLMTLLLRSLLYIHSLRKRYSAENITGLRFYNTKEPGTPFSFFRSIFWNQQLPFNSSEGQQIFRHELFHVKHRHSADRLLAEVLTALFWFNPFFHLIKKELKAIHEFLADQFAVSGSDRYAYATLLVQQALDPGKHAVTNHFFQNHIKRRIAMITQFQQSKYGYWSRVMVLPVALVMFCFISLYAKKPASGNAKDITIIANPASDEPVTDTLPDKEKKEMEQMKLQQERLKELQERSAERYQEMVNVKRDWEVLQKEMMEKELLLQQHQQNKREAAEKANRLNVEMVNRQQQLQKEIMEKTEKMKSLIKEIEQKAKEDPAYREEQEKKLAQMQLEMRVLQEQIHEKVVPEYETMKQQMLELQFRAQKEQEEYYKQQQQLILLNQRMRELQDTVPAVKVKKAKEAKPAKPQKPSKPVKRIKADKAEKVKVVEERAAKTDKVKEVKLEKVKKVEEKVDNRVEERRVIKKPANAKTLQLKPDSRDRLQKIRDNNRKRLILEKKNSRLKEQRKKEAAKERKLKLKPKTKESSGAVSDEENNETDFSGQTLPGKK